MDTDNQQNMPPASAGLQQHTQQQCQEVVKRKTKRHEYVEVDGFHFRRKRRTPPTPLANAAAANSAAAAAAAAGCGAGVSPAKQSPAAAAAVKHSLQLDDAAQPSPAKASAPPAADTDTSMADQDAVDAAAEAAGAQQDAPAPDAAADVDAAATAAAGASGADAAAAPTASSQQAAAAAAAAAAEAAQLAAAAAQAAAEAAAAQAAAADLEMVEASEDEPADEEQAPDSGPVQFSMLPSELCHLVGCFLAAELQKLTPFGNSPASARQAADSIRQQLEQRLLQLRQEGGAACQGAAAGEGGEGQHGGVGPGQEVPPLTVLPYQVEELKAKLVDKHSKLLQEQKAWMQLLAQYNSLAGSAEGDGGATPQEQQQDSAGVSSPAAGTGDAPADAPMTDAGEQGTAGAEVVVVAEEGCGGAAAAEEGGVEGPVCAEQQESVLGVQLKVEVLTALVSKMEHLVCRAEAAARALQAGYRAEKFGIFPHVDSPAALIKSLAGRGSQAATQGGTQAGSQGV